MKRSFTQRRAGAGSGGKRSETGKPPAASHPPPRPGGGTRRPDRHLFGGHAVAAALANPERTCRRLWCTDTGVYLVADALAAAQADGRPLPPPEIVERAALDRLVPPGAVHQGVVVVVDPLPPVSLDDIGRAAAVRDRATVVVLDQVTDPHNIGAVLRSTAAFGGLAVVVTDRHTPEITGTLARSASGAVEHVPLVRVTNLARALGALKDWGFTAAGLAEDATAPANALADPARTAIVLGAEGKGLRRLTRETCDILVHLPTVGPIRSLNVSNAAAVALFARVKHDAQDPLPTADRTTD